MRQTGNMMGYHLLFSFGMVGTKRMRSTRLFMVITSEIERGKRT